MVNATNAKVQYTGDGTTTVFAFPFKVLESGHLVVTTQFPGASPSVKTITTDYTVSGVGNSGGGTVTFVTAPVDNAVVTIHRATTRSQGAAYSADTVVNLQTLEASVDKLTLHVQELDRDVERSLRSPVTDAEDMDELDGESRKDRVVGFDGNGAVSLGVKLSDLVRLIIANPVAELADVTDYGLTTDTVTSVADYGLTS